MDIIVKQGVIFKRITYPIYRVLGILFDVSNMLGKQMVITSANDSKHKENSLHYKDLAIDIRIRHLEQDEIQLVLNYLRKKLGEDYDVILESDHIHIEYDPKTYVSGVGK